MENNKKFKSGKINDILFADIFKIEDIQHLQDMFSDAYGVASIITDTDGNPITQPSNFTELCSNIIRKTEKGCANCIKSDAIIGGNNHNGLIVQQCLSAGLWDAGASINVGGKHLANWLIGQIRIEETDENKMLAYADEIGANREAFMNALHEIPVISIDSFNKIARMLHAFVSELSEKAFKNWQLNIELKEKEEARILLQESQEKYSVLFMDSPDSYLIISEGIFVDCNKTTEIMMRGERSKIIGKSPASLSPEVQPNGRFSSEMANEKIAEALLRGRNTFEWLHKRFDGSDLFVEVSIVAMILKGKPQLFTTWRDISERKQLEEVNSQVNDVQSFLAQYSGSKAGPGFFDSLSKYLASTLDADFVCIDRLEGDGLNARTLSVWHNGQFEDNTVYALKDTPCGEVVGKSVCSFPSGVSKIFPHDNVLQDMKAESYVGVTLWSHTAQPIGLIAVIRQSPFKNHKMAEDLLKLVAERTAGELERIEAEQALKDSEEKYRNLLENSGIGVGVYDLNGKILLFNQKALDNLGVEAEAFIGKSLKDVFGEKYGSIYMQRIHNVAKSEVSIEYEDEIIFASKKHCFLSNHSRIKNSKGEIIGVQVLAHDITERKQAEEALKESRERYLELIELAVDGVLIGSTDGFIIDANSCICSMLGRNKEDIIGKHISNSIFTDESLQQKPMQFDRLLKGETVISERNISRPDGSEITIEMRTKMMPNHTYQSILRDITERKRVESEIVLKNEELKKINAEKDKFFSIISHDLRSPFNSFLGLTQIMAEELPNLEMDEVHKFAISMRKSATHLFRLLENLLEWSRMQQGLIPFVPQFIPLYENITESIEMIMESARNKNIKITLDIPENKEVFADAMMFHSIMRNIVANAVKFTPKGGNVVISAICLLDKSVEITIKDTGIGISKELMGNLFKLDVSTNRKGTEGELCTGLGLIICKDFIGKHGGTLKIESEIGKGSSFSFAFNFINKNI